MGDTEGGIDMETIQKRFPLFGPWATIVAAFLISITSLKTLGRLWICACGDVYVWVSDAWSSNNSQHLFDPYSFSHVEHGIVLFGLVWLFARKLSWQWRLAIVMVIECVWEVLENSPIIIDRYRTTTAALNYTGDTIINSLGDIFAMIVGFLICHRFGWKWGVVTMLTTELVMLLFIRDNLLLSSLSLVVRIPAIEQWQMLIR